MPRRSRIVINKEILALRRSLSAVDRSLRRFGAMLGQRIKKTKGVRAAIVMARKLAEG